MNLRGTVGDLHEYKAANQRREDQAKDNDAGGPGFQRFHRALPSKMYFPLRVNLLRFAWSQRDGDHAPSNFQTGLNPMSRRKAQVAGSWWQQTSLENKRDRPRTALIP